jgi:hypothetical protein
LVPSIGSTMKASSAPPIAWRRDGSRSVASSPTIRALGKAFLSPSAMTTSAASSASVTISNADVFCRTWSAVSVRKRGRISWAAARARIAPTTPI